MWIAGTRRRLPRRWPDRQDSGVFTLEHPYRGRAPEIHELVLAWLLDDAADGDEPPGWDPPILRPA